MQKVSNTSPVGYIEGWYVDADLRAQGLGRALVRAAEDWAIAKGCVEMGSDTWLDNEVSYGAHLAIGSERPNGRSISISALSLEPIVSQLGRCWHAGNGS